METCLATLLKCIGENELGIEFSRIGLIENTEYDSFKVFNIIDNNKAGVIDSSNLQNFLEQNKINAQKEEIELVIKQYDNSNKSAITFADFENAILPKSNLFIKPRSISGTKEELQNALIEFFAREIDLIRATNPMRCELNNTSGWSLSNAYKAIDVDSKGSFSYGDLDKFMDSQGIHLTNAEILAIFRRANKYNCGRMSISEFEATILPANVTKKIEVANDFKTKSPETLKKSGNYQNLDDIPTPERKIYDINASKPIQEPVITDDVYGKYDHRKYLSPYRVRKDYDYEYDYDYSSKYYNYYTEYVYVPSYTSTTTTTTKSSLHDYLQSKYKNNYPETRVKYPDIVTKSYDYYPSSYKSIYNNDHLYPYSYKYNYDYYPTYTSSRTSLSYTVYPDDYIFDYYYYRPRYYSYYPRYSSYYYYPRYSYYYYDYYYYPRYYYSYPEYRTYLYIPSYCYTPYYYYSRYTPIRSWYYYDYFLDRPYYSFSDSTSYKTYYQYYYGSRYWVPYYSSYRYTPLVSYYLRRKYYDDEYIPYTYYRRYLPVDYTSSYEASKVKSSTTPVKKYYTDDNLFKYELNSSKKTPVSSSLSSAEKQKESEKEAQPNPRQYDVNYLRDKYLKLAEYGNADMEKKN